LALDVNVCVIKGQRLLIIVVIALALIREIIEANIVIFSTPSLQLFFISKAASHLASMSELSEFPTRLRIVIVYGKE
jgi:hypothetical protein